MPLSSNPALLLDSCLHAIYKDREHITKEGLGRVSSFLSHLLARECVGYEMLPAVWCQRELPLFMDDLTMYCSNARDGMGYTNAFFRRVALPLARAATILNLSEMPNRRDAALAVVGQMNDTEWRTAMVLWIEQQYGASNVVQRVTVSGSEPAREAGDQPDARGRADGGTYTAFIAGNRCPDCREFRSECGCFISTGGEVP